MNTINEKRKKVLVVEDVIQERDRIINFIKDKYEVGYAGNGLAALEILKKDMPDVIILDLDMPVMGGIEFLKKCSESFPSVPKTLILTTKNDYSSRKETKEEGAEFYMPKPVDESKLLMILELMLSKK